VAATAATAATVSRPISAVLEIVRGHTHGILTRHHHHAIIVSSISVLAASCSMLICRVAACAFIVALALLGLGLGRRRIRLHRSQQLDLIEHLCRAGVGHHLLWEQHETRPPGG
jgi:hypothetical protein